MAVIVSSEIIAAFSARSKGYRKFKFGVTVIVIVWRKKIVDNGRQRSQTNKQTNEQTWIYQAFSSVNEIEYWLILAKICNLFPIVLSASLMFPLPCSFTCYIDCVFENKFPWRGNLHTIVILTCGFVKGAVLNPQNSLWIYTESRKWYLVAILLGCKNKTC